MAGRTPRQVAGHLADRQINVWDGDNYAWELTGVLGIRDAGGAVRAGLVHYNDRSDVDRLLERRRRARCRELTPGRAARLSR